MHIRICLFTGLSVRLPCLGFVHRPVRSAADFVSVLPRGHFFPSGAAADGKGADFHGMHAAGLFPLPLGAYAD